MDQERINQYREEQAKQRKEQELLDAIKQSGDKVAGAVQQTNKSTQKVQVQNDLATRQDVDSLIKQLKEVQLATLMSGNKSSVILADSTDLGEAVRSLGEKLDNLAKASENEKSDTQLAKIFKSEIEKVANILKSDTDTDVIEAINSLNQAISSITVTPVVNVPETNVTVDAPKVDLKPLSAKLDAVVKAVGKIEIPQVDQTDVLMGLDKVSQTINNLKFPVANFVQDPYIRYKAVDEYDDGVATNVKYYGFLSPEGNWYILKNDPSASAKTYRYAFGDSDYETNWTNRASLTYGYPFGR